MGSLPRESSSVELELQSIGHSRFRISPEDGYAQLCSSAFAFCMFSGWRTQMHNNISITIQILLARFNGQLLIPFTSAAQAAGFASQTARNLASRGKFPIPTALNEQGSRRFIHVQDLADYIDARRSIALKPKRGRPTKESKLSNVAVGA